MYQQRPPTRRGMRRINSPHKCLLAILLIAVHPVFAVSPPKPQPQSLESLVALALQQNPHLQAARTIVDAAEGGVLEAGRLDNPALKVDYASDQTFNNEGEFNFGLGFAQNFPITRRLKLERWIAKDSVRLAEAEITEAELMLRQEVEHAVYSLAALRAELTLRDQMLELNREWLRFIETRIERGEASEVDANRLHMEIYSMDEVHHELVNEAHVREAELRQLCGLTHDEPLNFKFNLTLPASLPQMTDFSRADLEQHPSYLVAARLLEIAEKNLSLARAERWADIEVEVFYREQRGVDAPDGLGRDRFFGVGFSIPLPIHQRGRGAISERQAAKNRMRWELRAIEAKLLSDASVQRVVVQNLYAQALEYQDSIQPILVANQKLMSAAYTSGQISLTDLFRTQEQSLHIELIQLEHLLELAKAQSGWRAATGFQTPSLSNTISK